MSTLTKTVIRLWIGLVSFLAFAVGWVSLSHAGSQVTHAAQPAGISPSDASTVSGVEFAPIPSLETLTGSHPASNAPGFNIAAAAPRLRTMGS